MKNIFLHTSLVAALLLLMACSNDNNEKPDNNGEINASQAVEFKVDFADFNAEQELNVTRSNNQETKLEQKIVDLGNGVLAQVTLQRDTVKAANQAATRALPNDTYTMLAYDRDTHLLKGEVTGKVTSNYFFTPTSKKLMLTAGNYDFVLFNSKVSRNGDNLTVTRANAATALIGRTTQEIKEGQGKNYVSFNMKHVGAKVKIKLTGYMPCTDVKATLTSINSTDVPGNSVYNAATDTWNTGSGEAASANTTYATSVEEYINYTYITTSNEAIPFVASTDVSKLKLTFISGNIYKQNMASAELTFSPKTTLKLEKNGAYILNVKLMYSFLYLMSDGKTGYLPETIYGGGTKKPIAVVVDKVGKIAVALKHAVNNFDNSENLGLHKGTNYFAWCRWKSRETGKDYWSLQVNTHMSLYPKDALNVNATSGYEETWNASYSNNNVDGNKVKGLNPDFQAFYGAAHYDPGVPVTGTNIGKWYLPSYSDVKWLVSLGFGNKDAITEVQKSYFNNYYWNLADAAFTSVGGERLTNIYTSTETYNHNWSTVAVGDVNFNTAEWDFNSKGYPRLVRPFVNYQ